MGHAEAGVGVLACPRDLGCGGPRVSSAEVLGRLARAAGAESEGRGEGVPLNGNFQRAAQRGVCEDVYFLTKDAVVIRVGSAAAVWFDYAGGRDIVDEQL